MRIDAYVKFVDKNGTTLGHVGPPYTVPSAKRLRVQVSESGTYAIVSLRNPPAAPVLPRADLVELAKLEVYGRYTQENGADFSPHW